MGRSYVTECKVANLMKEINSLIVAIEITTNPIKLAIHFKEIGQKSREARKLIEGCQAEYLDLKPR